MVRRAGSILLSPWTTPGNKNHVPERTEAARGQSYELPIDRRPLNSKNRPKFGGVQCRSSRLKSVPAANQKVGARKVTDVVCQATDQERHSARIFREHRTLHRV